MGESTWRGRKSLLFEAHGSRAQPERCWLEAGRAVGPGADAWKGSTHAHVWRSSKTVPPSIVVIGPAHPIDLRPPGHGVVVPAVTEPGHPGSFLPRHPQSASCFPSWMRIYCLWSRGKPENQPGRMFWLFFLHPLCLDYLSKGDCSLLTTV